MTEAASMAMSAPKKGSGKNREPDPTKGSEESPQQGRRIYIACERCRVKRIRCSGDRPTCRACNKGEVQCQWSEDRKRKRSKKESEPMQWKADLAGSGNSDTAAANGIGPSAPDSAILQRYLPALEERMPISTQHPLLDQSHGQHLPPQDGPGALSNFLSIESAWPDLSAFLSSPHQQISSMSGAAGQSSASGNQDSYPQQEGSIWMGSDGYVWPPSFDLPNSTLQPQINTALESFFSQPQPNPMNDTGKASKMSGDGSHNFDWSEITNSSPSTDQRIVDALKRHAAYIKDRSGEDEDLELFYYRFSGSTAIKPGINRVGLRLLRRQGQSDVPLTPGASSTTVSSFEPERYTTSPSLDYFIPAILPFKPSGTVNSEAQTSMEQFAADLEYDLWDSAGLPLSHVSDPLFELFFTRMSQYFPNWSRKRSKERCETKTMSAFLANCICALGARFSDAALPSSVNKAVPCIRAAPFIAKAQGLIVPLLHLPSYDIVNGLHLLAWASYGQNSESGTWQFAGMAFRMAIDLGIHQTSDIYESAAHVVRTRLLFWSLFVTDRVMGFATGRSASIPEHIVQIPLPEDEDLCPDPARDTAEWKPENQQVQPSPFVQLVKLMIICGRISDVLNGQRGQARTLVENPQPSLGTLQGLQMRLVQFVNSLHPSLQWSASNFKYHSQQGHGGIFLSIHMWSNSVLALVYHPQLLRSPSGFDTPLNIGMTRDIALSQASSRQICECIVLAGLVDNEAYNSNPFIVQPLYIAALAFIYEMRYPHATIDDQMGGLSHAQATFQQGATEALLVSMTRKNLSAILGSLSEMEQYWAGVGGVASILEQRTATVRSSQRKTFIPLPDEGLLRRFQASKTHVANVAPADETSLRESLCKDLDNA